MYYVHCTIKLTFIWLRLKEFLRLSCVEKLELGVVCLLRPTVGVAKGVTWHDWIVDYGSDFVL